MGTRADFYVGRGEQAEWLGSVAWDGYPDNDDYDAVFASADERAFRSAVGALLASRDDGTMPEHGWPWPWEDSHATDWAYAFDGGLIYTSSFGQPWIEVGAFLALDDDQKEAWGNDPAPDDQKPTFPNMKGKQNTTLGRRSGVMVLGRAPDGSLTTNEDKDERDEPNLPKPGDI